MIYFSKLPSYSTSNAQLMKGPLEKQNDADKIVHSAINSNYNFFLFCYLMSMTLGIIINNLIKFVSLLKNIFINEIIISVIIISGGDPV